MAQNIQYNGVEIKLAKVNYGGQAVYDTTRRVLQGYEMQFRISGLVFHDSSATPANYKSERDELFAKISTPRRRFTWDMNGTTLWDISDPNNSGEAQDRRWGPRPSNVVVSTVPGGRSCRVSFTLSAFVALCQLEGQQITDIEEFWWAFRYQQDRNFTTTRQISGRIKFRSEFDAPLEVLSNSNLYFPTLPRGFYRDGISHDLSPDGTTIQFNVTDRQVWRTLPRPMTNGSATMRVETVGAQLRSTLSGYFEAPHDIPKQEIAKVITGLIELRFPAATGRSPSDTQSVGKGEYFTSISFVNHEFDNRMDFTVSTIASIADLMADRTSADPDAASSIRFGQLFGDVLGLQVDGEPAYPDDETRYEAEVRGPTGTSRLIPKAVDPFDVCNAVVPIPPISQEGGENPDYENAPQASDGLDGVEENNKITSEEHDQYPYTVFIDTLQYVMETNIKVLPVATDDFNNQIGLAQPDIAQQTSRPTFLIIQTGTARRMNKPPVIPSPPQIGDGFLVGNAVSLRCDIRPEAPRVMADGITLEYKLSWQQTYRVLDVFYYESSLLPEDRQSTIPNDNSTEGIGVPMPVPENKQVVPSPDRPETQRVVADKNFLPGERGQITLGP